MASKHLRTAATAEDIAWRERILCGVSPLSRTDLAAFPTPTRVSLPAGAAFLRAGERASEVAVVMSGALREFFVLTDGSERTKGFNLAGDFAGSLSDLLSNEPARTWVVAERPTVLLTSPWPAYLKLVETRPAWTRFARVIAEQLYRTKVQREYELLALDAATRYRLALQRWPNLEELFSQRDIASYVGITPVHLSRLRASARKGRT